MKSQTLLPLALALSVAMFATACDRETGDLTPEPAVAPAPEPMEPTPTPPVSETATVPVDSGLTFDEMDENADGGITRDELADTEMLHRHFSVADSDGDGTLSSAEVDAHREAMAAPPAN